MVPGTLEGLEGLEGEEDVVGTEYPSSRYLPTSLDTQVYPSGYEVLVI